MIKLGLISGVLFGCLFVFPSQKISADTTHTSAEGIRAYTAYTNQRCLANMVRVGSGCMDTYEATVWGGFPAANKGIVRSLAATGEATPELLQSLGGVQYGIGGVNDYSCQANGSDCWDEIFAFSLPGRIPSTGLTQFQAGMACINSGKNLPSSFEWTIAALGTPDTNSDDGASTCNFASAFTAIPAGSRSGCVSSAGAMDMPGNVWEWVSDSMQGDSTPYTPNGDQRLGAAYGNDWCPGCNPATSQGEADSHFPSVSLRGGGFTIGSAAGVYAEVRNNAPNLQHPQVGLRCAK
jgi:hypothetical protein